MDVLHSKTHLIHRIEDFPVVNLATVAHKDTFVASKYKVEMKVRSVNPYHNSFDSLIKDMVYWIEHDYKAMDYKRLLIALVF